jgi:hypothetical protein
MEKEPSGSGAERRSSPRITTRSLVEVRLPDWNALRGVYTVNLSLGGMRLTLGGRPPLGAAVDIILTLPNGERLHLPGTVAHLGRDASGDVGVRFGELAPAIHDQIRHYLEEISAGRAPGGSGTGRDIPSGVLIKKKT